MTVKEIAKLCNVSTATVSNILNGKGKASEETVAKVMEVVKKTNYKPNPMAQLLRTNISKTIGVIAEDIAQFTTPDILEGIMEECENSGYRVLVENMRCYSRWGDKWYDSDEEFQRVLRLAIEDMKTVRVDGAIYIAGHTREIVGFSESFDVPNVVTHAFSSSPKAISVMADDVKGGYDVTKYLLDKGHRKIGYIGGRKDNLHTIRRLEGYQKALYEYGVLYNPAIVTFGNWDRQSGYECMKKLAGADITAVFSNNDQMSGGAYEYLNEIGKTPGKDMSIASFDNMVVAEYLIPGLTTMALNLKEIGRVSARKLFEEFEENSEIGQKIFVPGYFMERESVCDIN